MSVANDDEDITRGGSIFLFGKFKCDSKNYILYENGPNGWSPVSIRPKAFDVLTLMLQNPGQVIAPEEFMGKLWPNIHVQQEVLKGHILAARAARGDDVDTPAYIQNIRGRGYRFIAKVEASSYDASEPSDGTFPSVSLVGRDVARANLNDLLRITSTGEAQVGFITGEAGIGKTVLSAEFVASSESHGATIAIGRCFSGGSEFDAYAPLLELLSHLGRGETKRAVASLMPALAPTWAVQLPELFPTDFADYARRDVFGSTPHRMNRELCDLLAAIAKETQIVLLLEDVHWADRATLDLIEAIATRQLKSRILLIVTLRGPGRGERAKEAWNLCRRLCLYKRACDIPLAPLNESEVARFLNSLSGFPPPAALAQRLHAHSEGNPLFMRAILEHLLTEQQVRYGPDGWSISTTAGEKLAVPPSLSHLVEHEIEKLEVRVRRVLEAASLSDGPFSALVNAAGAELDEHTFEDACEELLGRTLLIQRGELLVMEDGRKVQSYEFKHSLFRLVAYDRQSQGRRATAHALIADRLVETFQAQGNMASTIAQHYEAAGHWTDAIRYYRRAARNVLKRFSNCEAAAALERAMSLLVHLPNEGRDLESLGLLEDLARAYVGALDPRATGIYNDLVSASKRTGRIDIMCRALLGKAFALAWTDCDQSMAIWQEAIDRSAELEDPSCRARVRSAAHGWRNWTAGWSEKDAAGCEAAIEDLRAIGDIGPLNAGLVDHTLVLFPSSRYLEAYETITACFGSLVETAVDQNIDVSLPLWIWRIGRPWSMMCAGQLGEALWLFDSGIEGFLRNGEIGRAATLHFYKALCCIHIADHTEALSLCRQARSLSGDGEASKLSPNEKLIGAVSEGLALIGLNRPDDARLLLEFAQQGVAEKRTLSTWHWRMALEWGLVDANLSQDRIEDAAEHGRILRGYAASTKERMWRTLACESSARIAIRSGDHAAAREFLADGWREVASAEVPLAKWRLHAAQAAFSAELGETEQAVEHEHKAEEALRTLASTLPVNHPGRMKMVRGLRTMEGPADFAKHTSER